MKKVNGVESVNVSLNEGKASIRFKPDSTGKYEDARSNIEKNGFVVKDASVQVHGKVQVAGNAVQLVVSGTGETFDVSPAQNAPADVLTRLQALAGKDVVIDGVIPTPEKNKKQDRLLVKAIVNGQ